MPKMLQPQKPKKEKKAPHNALPGAVAGAGATIGANTGLALAMTPSIGNGNKQDLTQDSIHQMGKEMGLKHNPDVVLHDRGAPVAGAAFNPQTGKDQQVHISRGAHESIAAHELGHLKNRQIINRATKSKLLRNIGHSASPVSRGLGTLATIPTSLIAGGEKDPSYAAGGVNAALWAPNLVEEGAASLHATRHLVGKYGLGQGLRKAMPLAPAFGTYAALGLTPLAITAYRKHKLRQQQAAMAKTSAIADRVSGFTSEMHKIAWTVDDAALLPGAVSGYYTGKSLAGHTAAITAPRGSKTRSEDIARKAAIVGAPAGIIGGLALSHNHKLPRKAAEFMLKKFPKGIIGDPHLENRLLHAGVPALAALGGGAAGGVGTGALVGGTARVKNALTGKKKESAAKKDPEPNLSFYEKHPKKILGGAAAAAALGGMAIAKRKDLANLVRRAKDAAKPVTRGVRTGESTTYKTMGKQVKDALKKSKVTALPEKKFKPSYEVVVHDSGKKGASMGKLLDAVDEMIGLNKPKDLKSVSGAPIKKVIDTAAPTGKSNRTPKKTSIMYGKGQRYSDKFTRVTGHHPKIRKKNP